MKILAFGDIHGDSMQAEKLAKQADEEKVDLVVICGDLTYFENSVENLLGPFIKKNQKVVIIPGNHETLATTEFLAKQYGATNLHGHSIKHKDIGFFGAGGATNVGPAPIITESEIFELLKKGNESVKDSKKKIMVTHMHPEGVIMSKLAHKIVQPSSGVKKAIDTFKPDILLCSHVHEAKGLEEQIGNTRVINVGKEGKIIEL